MGVFDEGEAEADDELFEPAVRLVVTNGQASTSMLMEMVKGRTADEILAARTELGPAVGGAVASELAPLKLDAARFRTDARAAIAAIHGQHLVAVGDEHEVVVAVPRAAHVAGRDVAGLEDAQRGHQLVGEAAGGPEAAAAQIDDPEKNGGRD